MLALLFLCSVSSINGQETVLYNVDLSKGSAPGGVVQGGRFVAQGWQITGASDQIRFNFSNGANIKSGYILVEMTNVAPHPQIKAVGSHPGKNQFIGLNENCDGSGIKIRYRHGTNYNANEVKTEIQLTAGAAWIERRFTPIPNYGDPSLNILHRIEWDSNGFRLSLNGKQFQSFPNVPKGFCTLTIGETFYPVAHAFPGPIYKSVKFVSRSGGTPATPTPTPENNKFTILLNKGWNLISLPLEPKSSSPADVLSSISGNYTAVYAFSNGTYQAYIPGATDNKLTAITAGNGYWIYMNQAGSLTIEGSAAGKSISLVNGWNLVGYNSTSDSSITAALASIEGKYVAVYAFDNASNTYKAYIPNSASELSSLKAGVGYWIYANAAVNWQLP
jgi:hypothetical protein